MRTTVTLDPDVERMLRTAVRERGVPFKEALNQAIRAGDANLLLCAVNLDAPLQGQA